MTYQIEDHPADAKFRVVADTKQDAFKEAVKAFSDIVGDESGTLTYTFEIESEGLKPLLFDFLDRLIFLQDTEHIIISHAEDIEIEQLDKGWKLQACVRADKITSQTYFMDVKAPTYSDMKIEYQENKGWVMEAVIDI